MLKNKQMNVYNILGKLKYKQKKKYMLGFSASQAEEITTQLENKDNLFFHGQITVF